MPPLRGSLRVSSSVEREAVSDLVSRFTLTAGGTSASRMCFTPWCPAATASILSTFHFDNPSRQVPTCLRVVAKNLGLPRVAADDLHLFDDRAGPSVGDDQKQAFSCCERT